MSSCRNDNYFEGNVEFNFSQDTLRFDTVFTEIGSATRWVKIFNPLPDDVLIESISMEDENSFFRMNVNGNSSKVITNVEIPAEDSIYVFIEVTIDPDNPLSISPFIIEDKLFINREGETQIVHLEAFGQNANYVPDRFSAGNVELDFCANGNVLWDDPKPYVVYGIIVVEGCTLEIAPGTRVYVHGGIVNSVDGPYSDGNITVGPNGTIRSLGTEQDTIVFQGDRLEAPFADVAGQWSGLRLFNESRDNIFSHTVIKNSILGLRVDSAAQVNLDHCQIYNTSSIGLVGVHAEMDVSNTLIHSNSSHGVVCSYGGDYNFDYCTIASYGNDAEAIRFDNYICRGNPCFPVSTNPINVSVDNCIITGSQQDELFLDDISSVNIPTPFNYEFRNTLVRVDEDILDSEYFSDFFSHCENCINYNTSDNDTLFVDIDENLYQLDTMSVAENRGLDLSSEGFTDDLIGNSRDPLTPDMGCYEFQQ